MFGPHFYYDVVRLARRGRSTILRVLYILALLGGLTYIYESTPILHSLRGNDLARVAERFAFALFVIQNIAVVVLTPAYLASALTEEKERRTLELLFTTQLSDTRIVLGKLTSRLLHLAGLVLAGLPILIALQFWGGIDLTLIAGNLLNTLLNILTIGSFCLLVSALCQTTTGAVLTSYAFVLPIAFCVGVAIRGFPFVLQDARQSSDNVVTVQLVGILAITHLALTILFVGLAILTLREHELTERTPTPPPEVSPSNEITAQTLDDFSMPHQRPPITDNALLWKELYVSEPLVFPMFALLILALPFVLLGIVVIMLWLMTRLTPGPDPAGFEHNFHFYFGVMRFFYYVFLAFCTLGVGYRAAVTVAREHQNQTLEPLLLLPTDRREILVAKLVGVLLHGWPPLALLGADVALGVLIGAYHPFSAVLLCLMPWPIIFFFATFGLLLSVAMSTVLRATLMMIVIQLAMAIALVALPLTWGSRTLIDRFAFSLHEGWPDDAVGILLPLSQLAPFAIGAFICWKLAVATFERLD